MSSNAWANAAPPAYSSSPGAYPIPPSYPQQQSPQAYYSPTSSPLAVQAVRERASQGVSGVCLSSDVFLVCMTHALTTEKDEICGLLLGQPSDDSRRIDISACLPLPRGTHRQKDRVEISPIQMAMGVEHADALRRSHGMKVRVVGWYHSHPRLMPIPSSVDVRSQEACEQQDGTFVGLIFTPFNAASKTTPMTQQLQVLAFKADRSSSLGFRELSIVITDNSGRGPSGLGSVSRWALDTLGDLLTTLEAEEEALLAQSKSGNVANFAYSYRIARLIDEIGYPLIEALESRLEAALVVNSSRSKEKHSSQSSRQHLLDATSPTRRVSSNQSSPVPRHSGESDFYYSKSNSSNSYRSSREQGTKSLHPRSSDFGTNV